MVGVAPGTARCPVSRPLARAIMRAGVEVGIGPGGFTAPSWAALVASAYADPALAVGALRQLARLPDGPALVVSAFGVHEPTPGAAERVADVLGLRARVAVVSSRGDRPALLIPVQV
jgi:hypothetical protein